MLNAYWNYGARRRSCLFFVLETLKRARPVFKISSASVTERERFIDNLGRNCCAHLLNNLTYFSINKSFKGLEESIWLVNARKIFLIYGIIL